jgi:ribose 1,5-bisphosphokinase PhnN
VEDQGERALVELAMAPSGVQIRLEPRRGREQTIHVRAREIREREKVALRHSDCSSIGFG